MDFADWLHAKTENPQDLHGVHAALFFDYLDTHQTTASPRLQPHWPTTTATAPSTADLHILRPWVPEVTLVHNQAHELVPERQRRHFQAPLVKNTALKAFFGVVLASLTVLMVEAALWLINVPDRESTTGTSVTVWWLKANLIESFRIQTAILGKPMPLACGDHCPRIRGVDPRLGCSTTFGWGVEAEESWPSVLKPRCPRGQRRYPVAGAPTRPNSASPNGQVAQKPERAFGLLGSRCTAGAQGRPLCPAHPCPFDPAGTADGTDLRASAAPATTARAGDYQDNLEIKAQFPNQTVYGLFFQISPNATRTHWPHRLRCWNCLTFQRTCFKPTPST